MLPSHQGQGRSTVVVSSGPPQPRVEPATVSEFVLLYQQLCQYLYFRSSQPLDDKKINHINEYVINQDETEDDVVEFNTDHSQRKIHTRRAKRSSNTPCLCHLGTYQTPKDKCETYSQGTDTVGNTLVLLLISSVTLGKVTGTQKETTHVCVISGHIRDRRTYQTLRES